MIGILGGMGTQAGLDFCNKLAILYRGKFDQGKLTTNTMYTLSLHTANQNQLI